MPLILSFCGAFGKPPPLGSAPRLAADASRIQHQTLNIKYKNLGVGRWAFSGRQNLAGYTL